MNGYTDKPRSFNDDNEYLVMVVWFYVMLRGHMTAHFMNVRYSLRCRQHASQKIDVC